MTGKIDKVIKDIQKIMALNNEQNELYIQMLSGILIKKHFGEDGGSYAIFRRKHFDRNYHRSCSEAYTNIGFYAKGYKIKPSKLITEDEIVLIDRKNQKFAIDHIKEIQEDKRVFSIAEKKVKKIPRSPTLRGREIDEIIIDEAQGEKLKVKKK